MQSNILVPEDVILPDAIQDWVSRQGMVYGKLVLEIGVRDQQVVNVNGSGHKSIAVSNRQELFDHILHELTKLDTCDQVQFTVVADRQTRQPARVVVVNEEKL